jgi:short-subunit dehydrogenase
LITGASRGIGAAAAKAFAQAGYHLLLVARSQADLDTLATNCAATGSGWRRLPWICQIRAPLRLA